jgi:hypothetical protein
MWCEEECSAEQGKYAFLSSDTKSGEPILCHLAYHKKYHDRNYTDNFRYAIHFYI